MRLVLREKPRRLLVKLAKAMATKKEPLWLRFRPEGNVVFVAFGCEVTVKGLTTVIEPGTEVVHWPDLEQALKALPKGDVTVCSGLGGVSLTVGGLVVKIETVDPVSLPVEGFALQPGSFEWKGGATDLRDALDAVSFAASKDPIRACLNGVAFDSGEDPLTGKPCLQVIALDGHRLARAPVAGKIQGRPSFNLYVLPTRAVKALSALCPMATDVSFALGKNAFWAVSSDWTLAARLEGDLFPDYRQFLRYVRVKTFCTVARGELLGVLKHFRRASETKVGEQAAGISLRFSPTLPSLVVEVGGGPGRGLVEIPARTEGEVGRVGVQCRFLLEALEHLSGDEVSLGFDSSFDPITVTSAAGGATHVVMPYRTAGSP